MENALYNGQVNRILGIGNSTNGSTGHYFQKRFKTHVSRLVSFCYGTSVAVRQSKKIRKNDCTIFQRAGMIQRSIEIDMMVLHS
jgi:hypothetical protein